MQRNIFKIGLALIVFTLSSCLTLQSVSAENYTLTDIGTLGGTESFAYAINDSGQVVGLSRMPGDRENDIFLYDKGKLTDISEIYNNLNPAYYGFHALDINDKGQIVAFDYSKNNAVLLSGGVATYLNTLGSGSVAGGINNSGQVVGYYSDSQNYSRAFVYDASSMKDLGLGRQSGSNAINNAGTIVGFYVPPGKTFDQAFLYNNGVATNINPFGGPQSFANNINNRGQIVGDGTTADGKADHAFLYSKGVITDLGTLGGPNSAAFGINDRGQIVGIADYPYTDQCFDPNRGGYVPCIKYAQHAFVDQKGVMTDLNSLIPSNSGWDLQWAFDINNRGQIVGYGLLDGKFEAYLLSPVPEPATMLLLGFGLVGLIGFRRKLRS